MEFVEMNTLEMKEIYVVRIWDSEHFCRTSLWTFFFVKFNGYLRVDSVIIDIK